MKRLTQKNFFLIREALAAFTENKKKLLSQVGSILCQCNSNKNKYGANYAPSF
jgi:hypothetical protein